MFEIAISTSIGTWLINSVIKNKFKRPVCKRAQTCKTLLKNIFIGIRSIFHPFDRGGGGGPIKDTKM